MRLFLTYTNAYQKVTLAEKFNNQVDSIAHSVQLAFLWSSLLVTAQWTHGQSGYAGEMEYIYSLNNIDFHSTRLA